MRASRVKLSLGQMSDVDLVEAFKAPETRDAAFQELSDRHFSAVRRACAPYFLKGGTRDDAEQEQHIAFLDAVRDYEARENGPSFRTFACYCAVRRMITAVQAANRKKHSILNGADSLERQTVDGTTVGATVACPQPGLDEVLSEREAFGDLCRQVGVAADADLLEELVAQVGQTPLIELARRCIGSDKRSRGSASAEEVAVLMGQLGQLSYREIGAEMSRSTKWVDNRSQRIRTKFRAHRPAT